MNKKFLYTYTPGEMANSLINLGYQIKDKNNNIDFDLVDIIAREEYGYKRVLNNNKITYQQDFFI